MKGPKAGNRTPFGILAAVQATGDADDLDTWHEWERDSRGRRQMAWTPGLREHLGMAAEVADEDVVDEDLGGQVAGVIPRPVWRLAVRRRETVRFLEHAEADDSGSSLAAYLARLGALVFAPDALTRPG